MTGMLNGFRVIEVEGLGPAPFAAMMLAELGAEVVVVHRATSVTPVSGEANLLDRGKKSIVLDLKDNKDLAVAKALIATADALIEGFRPGVMERLGLGPGSCHADNPRLVYGRMTGWGQTGPRAQEAGHDLNYLATSGALWYASLPGEVPFPPPTMLGDIGGGALYLVAGVLAGLINACKTGRGTVVDAAIVDGSAHMMALLLSMAGSGNLSEQRGQSLLDGPHWSRTYVCSDGKFISVQCLEAKFYQCFLQKIGLSENSEFIEQYRREKWARQTHLLANIFHSKPAQHWAEVFDGSDACVAIVNSPWEAAQDAHVASRNIWQTFGGDGIQPAPAPEFDGKRAEIGKIPKRGEHGSELREDLIARGRIS